MDDFERRLASRLSAYEQSIPAADAPGAAAPTPHRFAWAPIAAVVILAVGIGLVGSRVLSGVRPAGNGPMTSLTPSSPSATVTDEQMVIVDDAPDSVVSSLIETNRGLIAVGNTASTPRIWASQDGRSWAVQEISPDPVLDDPQWAFALQDVAAGDAGLVAVATGVPAGGAATETSHGAILWSGDGATWQRADAPASGCLSLNAVAAGPSSFAAAGHFCDKNSAAILVSSDGKAWQFADVAQATGGSIADVITSSDGFVAVGQISDASGEHPTVWGSDSGTSWKVMWTDPESAGGMTSVSPTPQGLIAGGWLTDAGGDVGVVWTAPDWSGWLPPTEVTTGCCSMVRSVAADDGRLYALLPHRSADGSQPPPPDLLESADGRGWQTTRVLETFAPVKVVITGHNGSFAVGSEITREDASIAALLRLSSVTSPSNPSPSPVATSHVFGPTPQPIDPGVVIVDASDVGAVMNLTNTASGLIAVGTIGGQPGIWGSGDGVAWHRVTSLPKIPDVPAETAVWVQDAIDAPAGYVAVGSVQTATDFSRPFAWVSDDGDIWNSASLPGSKGCGGVRAVTHGPSGGLIAAGQTCGSPAEASVGPYSAAVWASADGVAWHKASVGDAAGGGIDDVIRTSEGFVAVGSVRDGTSNRARVWESSDGEKWEAAWTDSREGALLSVAVFNQTVIAGGTIGSNTTSLEPAIWIRTARNAWTEQDPGLGCCGQVGSVAQLGNALFALAQTFVSDGSDQRTMLLKSTDGEAWQSTPLPESFDGIRLAVLGDNTLVALGNVINGEDQPPPVPAMYRIDAQP